MATPSKTLAWRGPAALTLAPDRVVTKKTKRKKEKEKKKKEDKKKMRSCFTL